MMIAPKMARRQRRCDRRIRESSICACKLRPTGNAASFGTCTVPSSFNYCIRACGGHRMPHLRAARFGLPNITALRRTWLSNSNLSCKFTTMERTAVNAYARCGEMAGGGWCPRYQFEGGSLAAPAPSHAGVTWVLAIVSSMRYQWTGRTEVLCVRQPHPVCGPGKLFEKPLPAVSGQLSDSPISRC